MIDFLVTDDAIGTLLGLIFLVQLSFMGTYLLIHVLCAWYAFATRTDPKVNPIARILGLLRGAHPDDDGRFHLRGDSYSGESLLAEAVVLSTAVVLVTYVLVAFWLPCAIIAIAVGLTYLSRFAVKVNEDLSDHIEDKDAHR